MGPRLRRLYYRGALAWNGSREKNRDGLVRFAEDWMPQSAAPIFKHRGQRDKGDCSGLRAARVMVRAPRRQCRRSGSTKARGCLIRAIEGFDPVAAGW